MRFESLSLRLRIFLFFAAIALGGIGAIATGFLLAYRRMEPLVDAAPLVQGAIVAGFGLVGLCAWVWYLFDTHLARPVESMASAMRARAHARVETRLAKGQGRYLGDLADAVSATATELAEGRNAVAESIARETMRLSADKERLEHLLADVPPAVLLCTGGHRLVFYNGVAQRYLSEGGKPVCLDRTLFDYLADDPVRSAHRRLLEAGTPDAVVEFPCTAPGGTRRLVGRMRLARDNGGQEGAYVMTLRDVSEALLALAPRLAAAPADQIEPLHSVVYDFDLLTRSHPDRVVQARLNELTYVVFDTETTGLLPNRGDEIVQIAAVRVVNGRIIKAESFETLVNPGRSIPPSATAIHGVDDAMVADAPRAVEAIDRFQRFCEGAVLVAHNAPFDMEFLYRREASIGRVFENPVLDTVLLSAVVFGQWDTHSLDALVERLDIDLPASLRHTAMGDAVATAEAFIKLKDILTARGIERLEDLLNQTRRHGRLIRDMNPGL